MSYRIDSEVVWIPADGEVRLYDPKAGDFRTLNSTAAEIWLLIAEGRTVEAVTAELARRHTDQSPAQIAVVARDVQEFVDLLLAQGLACAAEDERTAEAPSAGASGV